MGKIKGAVKVNECPNPNLSRGVCFSYAAYACNVINHLRKCNVPISKGLSEQEFDHITSLFGITFPPDLRSILQEGLPVGYGFPNWRLSSDKNLLHMINLPFKDLFQEVCRGSFWWKQWGCKPQNKREALEIALRMLKQAPKLVPIYSHCYIPCSPNVVGNPIFLVFKRQVFYSGYDLADFFGREVFIPWNEVSKIPMACSAFVGDGDGDGGDDGDGDDDDDGLFGLENRVWSIKEESRDSANVCRAYHDGLKDDHAHANGHANVDKDCQFQAHIDVEFDHGDCPGQCDFHDHSDDDGDGDGECDGEEDSIGQARSHNDNMDCHDYVDGDDDHMGDHTCANCENHKLNDSDVLVDSHVQDQGPGQGQIQIVDEIHSNFEETIENQDITGKQSDKCQGQGQGQIVDEMHCNFEESLENQDITGKQSEKCQSQGQGQGESPRGRHSHSVNGMFLCEHWTMTSGRQSLGHHWSHTKMIDETDIREPGQMIIGRQSEQGQGHHWHHSQSQIVDGMNPREQGLMILSGRQSASAECCTRDYEVMHSNNEGKVRSRSVARWNPSESHRQVSCPRIMSSYAYFHHQTLSNKMKAQFTISAPSWAAKSPRHIPFWGDLVVEAEEDLCDSNPMPMKELNLNVGLEPLNKVNPKEANNANHNHSSKRLLGNYLKDVERTLRKGGWKDDEIDDMIVSVAPSDENGISRIRTRAEMQDALIKNADAMFLSLQKAGWNAQDALEILNLDPKHASTSKRILNKDNVKPKKDRLKLGDFLGKSIVFASEPTKAL